MKTFVALFMLIFSFHTGSAQSEMRAEFLRQRSVHLNSQSRCQTSTGECQQTISIDIPADAQQLYIGFLTSSDQQTEATIMGKALLEVVSQAILRNAPWEVRRRIPDLLNKFEGSQDIDVEILGSDNQQGFMIQDASQGIEIVSDLVCGNRSIELTFENPQWFLGLYVEVAVVAVLPADQEAYRRGHQLMELAHQARSGKQYLEAIDYYDQAVQSFPHAEAFIGKAICCLLLGQQKLAKEATAEAVVHVGMQACPEEKQALCIAELDRTQQFARWDEAWIDIFGFSLSQALNDCKSLF